MNVKDTYDVLLNANILDKYLFEGKIVDDVQFETGKDPIITNNGVGELVVDYLR